VRLTRASVIKWVLLAAVTFAALRLLATVTDTDFSAIGRVPLRTVIAAAGLSLAFFPLSAARWHAILSGVGIRVPFGHVLRIILASGPLALLPGRLGDFGRVFGLHHGAPTHVALGSVLVEKGVDIAVLLLSSAAGFTLLGKPALALLSAGATGLVIALTLAGGGALERLTPRRYRTYAQDVSLAIAKLRGRPRDLARAVVSSAANWALSFLQTALILRALTDDWLLVDVVAWLPPAIFIGLIPLTIAGVGSRDAAFTAFMADAAPAGALVVTAAWYSVLSYGVAFVVGLPFIGTLWGRLADSARAIPDPPHHDPDGTVSRPDRTR
jgi:uncharacterized membrane protein YbhN (UPF0104 family)